jgi:hypothetical protein
MIYKDPNLLQHKALELVERHLDKMLTDDVPLSMATTIQNYMKVLVMVSKDQRDALRGFNPAGYSDEELDKLAAKAGEVLNERDSSSDEETDPDQ